jgi:hypothetical protein
VTDFAPQRQRWFELGALDAASFDEVAKLAQSFNRMTTTSLAKAMQMLRAKK